MMRDRAEDLFDHEETLRIHLPPLRRPLHHHTRESLEARRRLGRRQILVGFFCDETKDARRHPLRPESAASPLLWRRAAGPPIKTSAIIETNPTPQAYFIV